MVAGGANRSPNALILSLNSRIRVVYEKNKGFRELFRASLIINGAINEYDDKYA
jgi:hypothetical protein